MTFHKFFIVLSIMLVLLAWAGWGALILVGLSFGGTPLFYALLFGLVSLGTLYSLYKGFKLLWLLQHTTQTTEVYRSLWIYYALVAVLLFLGLTPVAELTGIALTPIY